MTSDPFDRHLGKRIEALRRAQKKSVQSLASELGITHQQVRKYENGQNRVSASTLYRLARTLNVTPSVFFQGMEHVDARRALGPFPRMEPAYEELLERVKDMQVREALRHLFAGVAKLDQP
ncbi:helix-turn-helix domain-containing protein [Aureimonas sp. AU20]|uniref:helix-turn-helix domain-containing protein n=1 Tax=Aureimonas sp. AU20 TaxID=1349819 RepID=UPI000722F145|nr:helix-turn-helix transcriptional regulator [Aureimonas sp. AU20]ALN75635.1 hypothetical protein M673_23115 [Aureimonas sp. AU20]